MSSTLIGIDSQGNQIMEPVNVNISEMKEIIQVSQNPNPVLVTFVIFVILIIMYLIYFMFFKYDLNGTWKTNSSPFTMKYQNDPEVKMPDETIFQIVHNKYTNRVTLTDSNGLSLTGYINSYNNIIFNLRKKPNVDDENTESSSQELKLVVVMVLLDSHTLFASNVLLFSDKGYEMYNTNIIHTFIFKKVV
jgi:hypothetical protein